MQHHSKPRSGKFFVDSKPCWAAGELIHMGRKAGALAQHAFQLQRLNSHLGDTAADSKVPASSGKD